MVWSGIANSLRSASGRTKDSASNARDKSRESNLPMYSCVMSCIYAPRRGASESNTDLAESLRRHTTISPLGNTHATLRPAVLQTKTVFQRNLTTTATGQCPPRESGFLGFQLVQMTLSGITYIGSLVRAIQFLARPKKRSDETQRFRSASRVKEQAAGTGFRVACA